MTFLRDKHYMQGTIVAMAAKMPEVILTEYGLLVIRRSWVQSPAGVSPKAYLLLSMFLLYFSIWTKSHMHTSSCILGFRLEYVFVGAHELPKAKER